MQINQPRLDFKAALLAYLVLSSLGALSTPLSPVQTAIAVEDESAAGGADQCVVHGSSVP